MKKILTMIICLAITGGAFAQEESVGKKKFTIGIKAGINVSSVVGSGVTNPNVASKVWSHWAVVSEFKVSDRFAIAPEILFSPQGFRSEGYVQGNHVKSTLYANYINIPIMVRFYVADRLSVEVGPQIGFLTVFNADMEMIIDGETISERVKMDPEEYNVFDLGLGFGVVYNLKRKFFVSARYNIGLTNVVKEYSNKNSVFQLSVGYNFL